MTSRAKPSWHIEFSSVEDEFLVVHMVMEFSRGWNENECFDVFFFCGGSQKGELYFIG